MALLVPCALLALLIAVSIVTDLFVDRLPLAKRAALSPAEMLECNRQVRELLEGIVREAARLEVAPLSTDIEDPAAEWDRQGKGWEARWRAADARCRFSQLADQGLGTAYDRMAWVHRSLPRTRLKFTERMARFSDDLAEEVGEMRRALDKSQAALPAAGQGNRP